MSVRFALLGLLANKPRHGYELRNAFEALVGGDEYWDVKPAQVYTTLERLREAGLVKLASDLGEGDEPSRRVYAITPAGLDALQSWFTSGVQPEHQRDEFFVKLMVALTAEIGDVTRILQTQRACIYQNLHTATTQRNALDPRSDLTQILMLDKAIMHLEADLRWIEFVEARLEEIKRQPRPVVEMRPRGRPKKNA